MKRNSREAVERQRQTERLGCQKTHIKWKCLRENTKPITYSRIKKILEVTNMKSQLKCLFTHVNESEITMLQHGLYLYIPISLKLVVKCNFFTNSNISFAEETNTQLSIDRPLE
jgi:hypothetical protein